jgi:hypothetical protein
VLCDSFWYKEEHSVPSCTDHKHKPPVGSISRINSCVTMFLLYHNWQIMGEVKAK